MQKTLENSRERADLKILQEQRCGLFDEWEQRLVGLCSEKNDTDREVTDKGAPIMAHWQSKFCFYSKSDRKLLKLLDLYLIMLAPVW